MDNRNGSTFGARIKGWLDIAGKGAPALILAVGLFFAAIGFLLWQLEQAWHCSSLSSIKSYGMKLMPNITILCSIWCQKLKRLTWRRVRMDELIDRMAGSSRW